MAMMVGYRREERRKSVKVAVASNSEGDDESPGVPENITSPDHSAPPKDPPQTAATKLNKATGTSEETPLHDNYRELLEEDHVRRTVELNAELEAHAVILREIEAEAAAGAAALDEQVYRVRLEAVEAEAMRHEKVWSDLEAARRLLEQHACEAADLESRLKAEAMAKRDALSARLRARRHAQRVAASDVAMEAELASEAEVEMNSLDAELRQEHMQAVVAMEKRHTLENDDVERARHLLEAHDERMRKLREELAAECEAKQAQLEERLARRRKAKEAVRDKSGISSEEMSAALDELVELEADAASEMAALDQEHKAMVLKKVEVEKASQKRENSDLEAARRLRELQSHAMSELESRLAAEATSRKAALQARLQAHRSANPSVATREGGATSKEVLMQALEDELERQRTKKLAEAEARHKRARDAAQDDELHARELLKEHERRKAKLDSELEARAEKMRSRLRTRLDTRRELFRAVLNKPGATDHDKATADEKLAEIEAEIEVEAAALDEQLRAEALEAVEAEAIRHEKVYSDLEAARGLLEQHARDAAALESRLKFEAEAKRDALRARLEKRRDAKQDTIASDVAMEVKLADEAETTMNALDEEQRKEYMRAVVAMEKRHARENDTNGEKRKLLEAHDERMRKLREELAAESEAERVQLEERLQARLDQSAIQNGALSKKISKYEDKIRALEEAGKADKAETKRVKLRDFLQAERTKTGKDLEELAEFEARAKAEVERLDKKVKMGVLNAVAAEVAKQKQEDADLQAAAKLRDFHAKQTDALESRLEAEAAVMRQKLLARLALRKDTCKSSSSTPAEPSAAETELATFELTQLDEQLETSRQTKLIEAKAEQQVRAWALCV